MSRNDDVITMPIRRQWNPGHIRPIPRWVYVTLALAVVVAPQLGRAEPVPLHFDTFTPNANVTNVANKLGPGYTGGLTMDFLSVGIYEGTTVDARVTAIVRPDTEFATGTTNRTARGYIPDYKATTPDQPNGDLGLLYAAVAKGTPGVTLTISFFDGTRDRSGKFSEACFVPDLRLLVYDVDGEPSQAEWFDAFYADGLYSYATGAAATSVTATPTAAGVHFLGPGRNFEETDTSGAVVLHYRNTSRITLAFGAEQYEVGTNPVFSAIDGDLGLAVTGGFKPPTVAPAPPTVPSSASRAYSSENTIRLDRLAPAEVPLNVPFDYTLKVTNVTQTPVHDVVVLERLPANFNVQSSDPHAERADATLSWKLGSLDPKASREIKVSGIATTADNIKPCATVTFSPPPVCADIAVVEPKLTFTATAPREVLVCDPIDLQFMVTNEGTGVAEGVQIVDALPAGLRTTDDKSELVLNVGTLAPGQSRQLAGSLKAVETGEYVARAIVTAKGGLKTEATTTTTVRQPVLAITKTGPARQYLSRATTYEITVTNRGDAPAADTVVEDTIPQAVEAVQTSPAGEISGSKVVWQLGTLAVNASKKVSITYVPTGTGSFAQTATASAVCANTVAATAETTVYGIAAVLLEVIDTDDPVQVGGRTTYTITATNQGSSPSTDVQIAVAVEDAQEIVATSGPTPVTVEGNTARSAPLATLAPKAKATWQITVKALKAGDVRFRATMTTAELGRDVEETEATQLYE
ncbi:MAG: DUF11 domain-containing protein [Sedimentisphaerales bacterium]|nr:DUF11 domain-containing protein [Sedimentisphaerales bacterium]